ncbi:pentatricopeptide repeat-containing protein At1g62680, mitochondrial-like [Beta vulgaris subsp. vulgaris]|uniref:pentatricopeptide repeat-containing protein At1g62680, mitochondrial-like n=1 Tax=Beta vulgaris subsp. vulgaris TaxID=3555 RepID=UPI0025486DFD|nr:pentatricopeptide repeat-containing protein At1g62680, mitochondrial-like [Beta vulgaris subsp. vulgaris]
MEENGCYPNDRTYNTIIRGYVVNNDLSNAFYYSDLMVSKGYEADTLSLFIGLLSSDNLSDSAKDQLMKFIRELELSGIRPDMHSIGILANCYCHLGRVNFGFSLLGKRLKLGYPFDRDCVIFTTLINGFIHCHKLPQTLQLVNHIVKLGFQPNIVTYGASFKGLCWIEAKDTLAEMLERNITPSVNTFNMLVDMFCKDGNVDEAQAIMSFMIEKVLAPNIITYGALLDGYCQMEDAEKLLDLMVQNGCEFDILSFSAMINGYCKARNINKTLYLFQEILQKGNVPQLCSFYFS